MFQVVVGHSDEIVTEDAVEEVLRKCEDELQGHIPQAGIVFSGMEYEHGKVLQAITDRFPGVQLIGCTTDGEMTGDGGFTEDAIALTLFVSDTLDIRAGCGERVGSDPHGAAAMAVEAAAAELAGPVKLALVLPDGLTSNAYETLGAFNEVLGLGVPVVGGMSADRVGGNKTNYSTHQFFNEWVVSDAVPILLFSGPLVYSIGVESGWSPIGKRMTVTRAEKNVLHELDGRPAFELYTHYLGDIMRESITGLGSYPLAIYEQGLDRYYLRVAKQADPESGCVSFLGEIPVGAKVQITQAIRDQVIKGVQRSVEHAWRDYRGQLPSVAMMFSCTGRKIALGTKTGQEVHLVKTGIPSSIPMIGFYTFGEIGPLSDHTRARYHNTTFVTLLVGEA